MKGVASNPSSKASKSWVLETLDSILKVHKYAYNLCIEYQTRRLLQQLIRLFCKPLYLHTQHDFKRAYLLSRHEIENSSEYRKCRKNCSQLPGASFMKRAKSDYFLHRMNEKFHSKSENTNTCVSTFYSNSIK